jgi:hypothetical protein
MPNITRYCDCGTLVWDVPSKGHLSYHGDAECWNCGAKHRYKPFPWYYVWMGKMWLNRQRRKFRRARHIVFTFGGRV